MIYEDRVVNKQNNKECIPMITEAAKAMAAGSENIQRAARSITMACNTPGTNGNTNKDMLIAKVDDMERLSALQSGAAKRLMDAVRNLEEGKLNDNALYNIITYGLFLVDQLKCEEAAAYDVLRKLRDGSCDSFNSSSEEL